MAIFIHVFSLFISLTAATCYRPDGTAITNPSYQPCNQVLGQDSMCCGTNHTEPGVAKDVCESNGLCQNFITWNSGKTTKVRWRGSCTDSTWESPQCLKDICVDNVDSTGNEPLSQCDDGSWCCGVDENNSCCLDVSKRFELPATIGQTSTISSTSTSSSSIATSASTATTETTPMPSQSTANPVTTLPSSSKDMHTGTIIGIAVGVAAGISIIAIVFWWMKRTKYQQLKRNQIPNQWHYPPGHYTNTYPNTHPGDLQHSEYYLDPGKTTRGPNAHINLVEIGALTPRAEAGGFSRSELA